MMNIID